MTATINAAQFVGRVQTKPTKAEWLHAVRLAFQAVGVDEPTHAQFGVLWGMFGMECGYGASCWNGNAGNIRAFAGYTGRVLNLPGAWEVDDKGVTSVTGGAFRAYGDASTPIVESLTAGYVDLFNLLKIDRYAAAFAELIKAIPNPRTYIEALKAGGYFTGNLLGYENTVASIDEHFDRDFASTFAVELAMVQPLPQMPPGPRPGAGTPGHGLELAAERDEPIPPTDPSPVLPGDPTP